MSARFPSNRSLAVAIVAALAASQAARAQQAAPAAAQPQQQNLETVIVTGTRALNRTVAESLSPIDIVTPEALQATGTTELATALVRVVPSLNFPRPALVDGTDAVRPAQLRGLSPDQVLVLVNGKRWHSSALVNVNGSQGRGSAPVDLNAIPIAAIERVEVLRDGASAQYGSDAIAGVVNIVLKSGSEHGSATLQTGQYSAGDGAQVLAGGDIGFKLGDRGWVHLSAQYLGQDQTDRAQPYVLAPGVTVRPVTAPPSGVVAQRFGDPQLDQYQLALNSEYKLGEDATLYGIVDASNRNSTSNGLFRAAGDSRNIPSIYPNGFLPLELFNVQDRQGIVGLRGLVGDGWHYDLSADYGYNRLTIDIAHSLNTNLGVASPTRFYDGALKNEQGVLNADFNKDVSVGFLPNPVTVAFGAEYRHETYEISPGEPASYYQTGAQVFPGFQPGDSGSHSRHSYAAYFDLETNLTDKLSAGLAGRWEDYSDFGSALSGKLSLRYQFTEAVALRATISNGFRAPSLAQEYFSTTSSNLVSTPTGSQFQNIRTFAVTDPAAIALGAEPLKAEKSRNYSLGLVLQPTDALSATIDAYQITVDDRIILSGNLNSPAVQAYLQAHGFPGVQGGRYFTNAADTRTRGIDAVVNYKLDFDHAGTLNLSLAGNYNKTDVLRIQPNPPILAQNGFVFPRVTRDEIGRLTVGSPRNKYTLGADWTIGSFTLRGDATRYGDVTVLNASNPALDQTYSAKVLLNLSGTYHLDRWDFTVGADNITNEYPDKTIFANTQNGQLPYTSYSPFGFNGAYVYGKAVLRW